MFPPGEFAVQGFDLHRRHANLAPVCRSVKSAVLDSGDGS
jgi:hypothetical protein